MGLIGCVVVWSPNCRCSIDHIECLQKVFIKFSLQGLTQSPALQLLAYANHLKLIHLPNPENRRGWLNVSLIIKVLSGECGSPFFLSDIDVHLPARVT